MAVAILLFYIEGGSVGSLDVLTIGSGFSQHDLILSAGLGVGYFIKGGLAPSVFDFKVEISSSSQESKKIPMALCRCQMPHSTQIVIRLLDVRLTLLKQADPHDVPFEPTYAQKLRQLFLGRMN